jgi:hypothetical protein
VRRTLAACVLAVGFAVGCTRSGNDGSDASTSEVELPSAGSTTSAGPSPSTKALVMPTVAPSRTLAPSPTPFVTPTPRAVPTPEASPSVHVVDLKAILEIRQGDRFETFGGDLTRLEAVWSPADPGLGGTCLPSDAWLECGLQDWLIQPSRESEPGDYDGPRLDLFFGPGVRERLDGDLRPGEGPFAVVGHFDDPAAQECRPENQDRCRDLFVVTAIDLRG